MNPQNTLVLASNNTKKAQEIRELLPGWTVLSLEEVGFAEDIPEPYETFEENAAHKARTVYQYCRKPVLADDSGLCVEILNGAPGIYSARYSGIPTDDARNNAKLLVEMSGKTDRRAKFVCVIALAGWADKPLLFRGEMAGSIAESPSGNAGFGYDPLFVPEGQSEALAALPIAYKKQHSHRAKALEKLRTHLQEGAIRKS